MGIIDRFYSVSPVNNEESKKFKYVDEHQKTLEDYKDSLDQVKLSFQVDNAEGRELDEIGKIYGELGRRRGRSDADYRSYLKSIITGFGGRGTIPDIKFGLETAIFADEVNIVVEEIFGEYFDEKYTVSGQYSGTIPKTPVRYRDNNGNTSTNYITWTDTTNNKDLTVTFDTSGSLGTPSTDEVLLDWSTGEWKADSGNTSGDYEVQYEHQEMLGYKLFVKEPWSPHSSKSLIDIIDLIDASVAHLIEPTGRLLFEADVSINSLQTENKELYAGLNAGKLNEEKLNQSS